MRLKYLVTLFLLLALTMPASPAHAGGIVSICDEAHLLAALAGGGTVTFSCSGTITLSSTITIAAATALDGSGQNVTISGNQAVRVFTVNAGATLNLNKLTIANGRPASDYGGGIYNKGTVIVSNSTFSGNFTKYGGGIYNSVGTVIVSNSTFSGNSAFGGGGIYNSGGMVIVSNSTFSGNAVDDDGGGISNEGTVTVSNSTFSGNFAGGFYNNGGGGGIYNEGTVTVSNSTFSGNKAFGGGGIYNSGGMVTLKNTIVANSPEGGNCYGSITDGGGNLSFGDTTCPGINGDPKLGPLQNNGGPTQTMALESGSAALDAANDATCAAVPVNNLDQRGFIRPSGAHCDIGAYETLRVVVSICDEAHLLAAISAGYHTVTFSCSGTIPLTAAITIATDTILDGSGQSVTISGHHAVRLFFIPAGSRMTLRNLTLAGGQAINDSGGAIYNLGSLVMANISLESNAAAFHGGAIVNYGTLDVSDSVFLSNEAGVNGGAIDSTVQLSVHRSTFTENLAGVRGGAINNYLGTMTVEESRFESNSSTGYGGGLVNDGGTASIRASQMVRNTAQGAGGGIKNSGTLNVRDSTLSNNSAGTTGGGIDNADGRWAFVRNSTFSGNSAQEGGGIDNDHGVVDVSDSTFSGNIAHGRGGGISNVQADYSGTLSVSRSTFSDNSAGTRGGGIETRYDGTGPVSPLVVLHSTFSGNGAQGGGGIDNDGGAMVVDYSTFSGNSVTLNGGGIFTDGGAVEVSNSTFTGNRAYPYQGGGIENNGSTLNVTNSTFSGNSAGSSGGGILNTCCASTATVINSTFSGNSASGGGGIANLSTLTLKNTIVANSPTGGNCDSYSPITDGGGNLSFGDTTCPGIYGDPRLGPLQNNGGPTDTLALEPGSAAIDAANDETCSFRFDQRGVSRPQGPHCDIGAYEAAVQPRRMFLPIISGTVPPTAP